MLEGLETNETAVVQRAYDYAVNYPVLTDRASWLNEAATVASPQALLPAVPAVDFRRIF